MKKKASFTVESSFIIPIIMMIIVSLIYYNFYLHNQCAEKAKEHLFELKTEESEKRIDAKEFIRSKRQGPKP